VNARLAAVFLALAPLAASAQGFAGLGTTADGFTAPEVGRALDFPADRGAHPDYRIEWWYVTATLQGADGTDYGAQWTLFRNALLPEQAGQILTGWDSPQVWMGHAALTTPDHHYFAERLARGGTGQAGVTAEPFAAWLDEWALTDVAGGYAMTARGDDFGFELQLAANGPRIAHGDGGYSVKSASGQASYYYSEPFLTVTGSLTLPSGVVEVTGNAWLDREWSSQPLDEGQGGWDWFSLSFEGGDKLMAFWLRGAEGVFSSGTWIGKDGTTTPIANGEMTATPVALAEVAGHSVPVQWRLTDLARGLDVTVSALNPKAWNPSIFPYWEGPVAVAGSHSGRGYLEMTGYD